MNWENLQLLHAAATCGSLSKAARQLRLSQPQLSRRLKAIEADIGQRLFERLPTGIKPTAAGERLIPLLNNVADAAAVAIRAKPEVTDKIQGTVRVSAEVTIADFIARHGAELINDLPEVEIEVLTSHSEVSLSRREADLLVRACLPDGGSLICRKLGNVDYAIFASSTCIEGKGEYLKQELFTSMEWVGFAEDRLFFPEQKKWLDSKLAKPPRFRATEMNTLVSALVGGTGVGIIPCFIGCQIPNLICLSPPIEEIRTQYYLLAQRELLKDQAVFEVKERLVKLFAKHKMIFEGSATK